MGVDLRTLIPAPRTVNLGNGEAAITGLTLEQLASLMGEHAAEIQAFLSSKETDVTALVTKLPDLAVKLIAMGLKAEGQEDVVRQIPVATQINILLDLWELSVPDPKKFMARLSGLSDALKKLVPSAPASQSPSGNQLPSE